MTRATTLLLLSAAHAATALDATRHPSLRLPFSFPGFGHLFKPKQHANTPRGGVPVSSGVGASVARPSQPLWRFSRAAVAPAVSYIGLGTVGIGAATLVSSIAGAGASYVVAGSILAPAALLLLEFVFMGGGQRVARMMGGQPADMQLVALVQEVAQRAGLRPPKHVYEIPTAELNAFAAGLGAGDTTVAVTSGLRQALSPNELRAVVAHEIGHVRHCDVISNMHTAVAVAGLGGLYTAGRQLLLSSSRRQRQRRSDEETDDSGTALLGWGLIISGALFRLLGEMARLGLSRHAEFQADAVAAELYGSEPMVSALRKIEQASLVRERDALGARDSLFSHAYIYNKPPAASLASQRGGGSKPSWWQRVMQMFSTHPPVEERVQALRRLSQRV